MATKAEAGDLIITNVYCGEGCPIGTTLRVHKVIQEIEEVIAYPTWYEEGMACFGFVVFLENEDYEVVPPK